MGETERQREILHIYACILPLLTTPSFFCQSASRYTPLTSLITTHPTDRTHTRLLPHIPTKEDHNNTQDVDHHHPLLRRPRRRQHVLRHALRRPKRRLSPTKARKPTLPRRRRSTKSRRKLPIPHHQLLQRLSRRLPHRRFPRLLRRRQHAHQLGLSQRSSTPRLADFHFSGIFPSRSRFATQHSL